MTTTDDLFAHIRPAREMYQPTPLPGTEAWHRKALKRTIPPVNGEGRPTVQTRCLVCERGLMVLLGDARLCPGCAPTARATLEAEIAALIDRQAKLAWAWEEALRLADPATLQRWLHLDDSRQALITSDDDHRRRVENGIAKARAKGDGLSELLATELELGSQFAKAGERLAACREAIEELALCGHE